MTLHLSHWPVARRLFAVIVAALVMGLVFGGLRVADAESSATQLSKAAQFASLGQKLTVLVNDLQNERDQTVADLPSGTVSNALTAEYQQTDRDYPAVVAALQGIGSGFPANIQNAATTALTDLNVQLIEPNSNSAKVKNGLHDMLDPSEPQSETSVIQDYGAVINDLLTLTDQVGQGVADAQLTSDVRAQNALALAKEEASQQRAYLNSAFAQAASALAQGTNSAESSGFLATYVPLSGDIAGAGATVTSPLFDANDVQNLTTAYDEEFVDESAFQQAATPAEEAFFVSALGTDTPQIAAAENIEQNTIANEGAAANAAGTTFPGSPILDDIAQPAPPSVGTPTTKGLATVIGVGPQGPVKADASNAAIAAAEGATPIGTEPTVPVTASTSATAIDQAGLTAWDTDMGDKIGAIQSTELLIAGNISNRISQLQAGAQDTALLYLVITLLVLLIVVVAALLVARSVVLPLRRLRAGALNIASVQLPERVRLLSENPESAATMEVAPINVVAQDEIGQVARAFDQVHSEAVRLAGEQAVLRSSFNAMFVNLSRRSQSLIERLARMIDNLEQTEDDPDRLGNLFSMDHLVTRMRRNSENLLLLAGHENPRKWSESIALADVARAATSEIEQYNRVTLNVPAGISIVGQAVSDVVHLLAELVENATIFSPKDTQVSVTMQELASGGVLIEVLDKGIGVSEARLADMNWRLDNPPTIDVSVSRHMGLFAVARLAERHRVRVRLRPASPQGLSALVWLPDSVIERVGRYGPVTGTWSSQPVGATAGQGFRQLGGEQGGMDGGAVALAQAGAHPGNGAGAHPGNGAGSHPGNGAGNGNGNGNGNGYGAAQTARSASGWFRGRIGDEAPDGGYGAPRWGDGRNPAEIIADPTYGDQTTAGLPVRVPRANLIPGKAAGGPAAPPAPPPGPASQAGAVSQSGLPIRGADPGASGLPSRGAGQGGKGLPTREPGGRVGGNAGSGGNGTQSLPQRSPDHARSRLAGFQRGTRRAETQTGQQPGQAPRAGEGSDR
ncbi:MAG TPA: nitrate- and nitrite sensing domain-containing protein [Trebonia sp.]|nr:nitrate- and nitrite sensing domain-containing protein [Trebonia sp.]